jgi:hypothetical protein
LKKPGADADTRVVQSAYVFTPTQRAETVQEFLAVCRSNRELARHHLAAGYFEPWLRDQGRDDLAARAARVREEPEGLELFLKTARPSPRKKAA